MRTEMVGDVAGLDTSGYGPRTLTWWGTLAFMSLEGMGFALAAGAYLYLMSHAQRWPLNAPLPNYWPGTVVAILLVASAPLNHLLSNWARAKDLKKVRIGLVLMSLLGIAPLIVRCFEFPALHVGWDTNAYGSALWFLLGLHTTHILTDVVDTLVLTGAMFSKHGANPHRFADVTDNAFYWDFVILTWLPIYGLIYWVPRLT
ncbi:MAG TPA: cytochrome c oxidase subunit 3 [Caulobacteraceae bacterium]|nr:cytochrome c oxidase subunit 3 [Caulobacteraceae bacterium]